MSHTVLQYTYRVIGDVQLKLNVYTPEAESSKNKKAAIIFFFGGGWVGGTIDHFKPQSEYLSSLGMVAITPEYRLIPKHGVTPFACVEDAKAAVKWVYDHSEDLGIDPDRIVVGGGSAGGHLAACTAVLKNSRQDPHEVFRIPKALILFNPVVDTTASGYGSEKIGENAREISPVHNITPALPPTIIFHGLEDQLVPFKNVKDFCDEMVQKGSSCTLVPYEGKGHGFFNRKEGDDVCFKDTLHKMETFLIKQGYLSLD